MAANFAKLPELLLRAAAEERGVTRLPPSHFTTVRACPLRPQLRKYRCNAISVAKGQILP